jgi:hypothetical protein
VIEDSNDSFPYDNDSSSLSLQANLSRIVGMIKGKQSSSNTLLITPSSSSINNQVDYNRLIECLNYLHSLVGRKDKEAIFEFPVTDDIAPGYSSIIKNPMDLTTMKKKIESRAYKNIMEYRVLILN